MTFTLFPDTRRALATDSLAGLSVGDALGAQYFVPAIPAGGDVDTTGAIAGGVAAAHTGAAGIPPEWLAAREPLPDWLRHTDNIE